MNEILNRYKEYIAVKIIGKHEAKEFLVQQGIMPKGVPYDFKYKKFRENNIKIIEEEIEKSIKTLAENKTEIARKFWDFCNSNNDTTSVAIRNLCNNNLTKDKTIEDVILNSENDIAYWGMLHWWKKEEVKRIFQEIDSGKIKIDTKVEEVREFKKRNKNKIIYMAYILNKLGRKNNIMKFGSDYLINNGISLISMNAYLYGSFLPTKEKERIKEMVEKSEVVSKDDKILMLEAERIYIELMGGINKV